MDTQRISTRKAVDWFLPRIAKTSEKHQARTKRVLGLLCQKVGGKALELVTAEEIETVVNIPESDTTRDNYLAKLRMFFHGRERFPRDDHDRLPGD